MPAHTSNYRRAGRASFSKVIIHATDGRGDPYAVVDMWREPHHNASAHFVVGLDGTVIQAVSIADVAYHAHQINLSSVGVEHCCRTPGELGPNDPGLKPTPIQLRASAALTLWLCGQGGFNPSRKTIQGHAEADEQTTHADCPEGAGIILDAYVGLVFALQGAPFA